MVVKSILCAATLMLALVASAQDSTNGVIIRVAPDGAVSVSRETNGLPTPPMRPLVPLSVTLRQAVLLARSQAAPWNQRFIVTKVEESALPTSTNYTVTILPLTETNAPVAWGPNDGRTIRFVTSRSAKVGDAYDFYPVPVP